MNMNRFDWTFSGSAELVTGILLAALIINVYAQRLREETSAG